MLSSGLGTCWGYNASGQIGNGSTTDVHTPTGVTFGCTTCTQPDVLVSATSWSPQAVSAGGTVTFSATVFNAGTGITPVGTIVGVRWDIDGSQTNWSDSFTTGLAPGASVTLTANGGGSGGNWTTTSGSHTLQAWVDDVNRFAESDETNNKLTKTMTLGMDLVVSSLTWSPSTPSAGTATTFSCVVTNIGTAATPGGTVLGVRFDIDGSAVNWEDNYTTSLAAGASVTLTANSGPSSASTWSATSGTHTLQGWVDDVNRFGETNRANNTTTTTIVVP
jgi:subtilase family serine protease